MALTNKHLLEQILTSKDIDKEQIDLLIKSFLFENTKDEKVKFDIFNFCSKDEMRPIHTGVFYDNGYSVASDFFSLVVIKGDYLPEYNGCIVTKKGEVLDGKYPDYNALKPSVKEVISFDLQAAKDFIKKSAIDKKQGFVNVAKIGGLLFSVAILKNIVAYVSAFNPETISVNVAKSQFYCENENGSWGVFMAMVLKEGHDRIIVEI